MPNSREASTSMRPMVPRPAPSRPAASGRTVFLRIVALAAGVRVALELVGILSMAAHGLRITPATLLELWSRWDAPHYLRLAEVGYRTTGEDALLVVFFPAYPLAVGIVSFVARDLVLAGLLVSFAASVGAAWLLYRLVSLDADHDEAWRAVLLLFAFPTAYFLSAPYTESLFLFAVLAAVYAARAGRWGRASVAGALAAGTRVAGAAILPALAAEALGRGRRTLRGLTATGISGTGLAGYLALNRVVHGDALHFLDVQRNHWFQRAVPPWQPLGRAIAKLASGADGDFVLVYGGRLAATALGAGLLVAGARRLRTADQVYGWAGLLLVGSASWLISLPRYLLGLYPLFVVGAYVTRRRAVFAAALTASVALQVWFFWRYAAGAWTF